MQLFFSKQIICLVSSKYCKVYINDYVGINFLWMSTESLNNFINSHFRVKVAEVYRDKMYETSP